MKSNLLQRYERDLALKGFSPRTQKTYFRSLVQFLNHTATDPKDITKEIIKDYLYHLINDRKLSPSSLRQARSAICYFFSQTLSKPIEVENIPCQIKQTRLPAVFSVDEVFRILRGAENLKHRTMLSLTYSSGLRVGELVTLKVTDIRRNIMRLAVRQAKGHKDRYAILVLPRFCGHEVKRHSHIYTSSTQTLRDLNSQGKNASAYDCRKQRYIQKF